MILPFNVLTLSMVFGFSILCHFLPSIFVTKQCHELYIQRYCPKFYEELPKPNEFLHYFKSYNVFEFHNRVNSVDYGTFTRNTRDMGNSVDYGMTNGIWNLKPMKLDCCCCGFGWDNRVEKRNDLYLEKNGQHE